jgi:Aspartyl/Asparaginyl beta-hydroxylase
MPGTTVRFPDTVRQSYVQLIDALLAADEGEAAGRCADLAVELGVWRHPLQRPAHYLPSLDPLPVYDPADFWFCSYLEDNFGRLAAELGAVTDPAGAGFLPVEEPLLGAGRWEQVTFYETGQRFDDACARFPVTASVIEAIPEATAVGVGVVTLSWLYPGTRIVPHCGGTNARLRVHLGLRVPGGAQLRVGDQVLTWQEGRCIVFDDSFEHEVWHEGDRPRVVLLMDVSHPGLDAAARERMLAGRKSYAERVRGFLAERGIRRVEMDGADIWALLDTGTSSQVLRHLRESDASSVELHDGTLSFRPGTRASAGASDDR